MEHFVYIVYIYIYIYICKRFWPFGFPRHCLFGAIWLKNSLKEGTSDSFVTIIGHTFRSTCRLKSLLTVGESVLLLHD